MYLSVQVFLVSADFLDDIKSIGYKFAFQGGLSFSLGDIIIPQEKQAMIADANEQVQGSSILITWG